MGRKIDISELSECELNFNQGQVFLSKDKTILNLLISWVDKNLENKKISHGDIMPSKKEIAKIFKVSPSTVQNAIRYAEDMGYFESKQCVGTMIKDKNLNTKPLKKMSSKLEVSTSRIKKLISKIETNKALPPIKEISEKIGISKNTVRLALENLAREGFLKKKVIKKNNVLYAVMNKDFQEENLQNVVHKTLSQKLSVDIKKYIATNFKVGDKIIKNQEFSRIFNVSVRTINDAMKILNKEGIILSRRGQYGTIYIAEPIVAQNKRNKNDKNMFMTTSSSIKKENILYNWQKTLNELKKYISKNYEAGDKLPPITELVKVLNTTVNSLRKSVEVLKEAEILHTSRGKYGGIFVNDMPEDDKESYSWLALNPKYFN